jgi:hypothetical protein
LHQNFQIYFLLIFGFFKFYIFKGASSLIHSKKGR